MPLPTITRRGLATLLATGLVATGALLAPTASAAPLAPSSTMCTTTGTNTTCDLYAKVGSVSLPTGNGAPQPVTAYPTWSYSATATDPAGAVGPTFVVTQGNQVTITLHNGLAQPTSLSIPQVDSFPDDATGAASGGSTTYTFTADRAGTYLYEAGPTTNGPRQVALGMVGALVVLPATAPTTYQDEAVLVVTDLDPALNADPSGFDMRNYAPRYTLLNGLAHPNIPAIEATGGNTLRLRQVNAGIIQHSLGVLGANQTVVAASGRDLTHPYGVVAEVIPAGDTLDTLVKLPAVENVKYPVYDTSTRLDNWGGRVSDNRYAEVATGGALTYIQTGTTGPGGGTTTTPPVVTGVTVTPQRSNGTGQTFSAAVTGAVTTTGGVATTADVTDIQYVVDDTAGTPTAVNGFAPASSVSLSGVPFTVPGTSTTGAHSLLVRASSDGTTWGPWAGGPFTVDRTGPNVSVSVTPQAISSGSLTIGGTASDVGGGVVSDPASYAVSPGGATGTVTVSPANAATVGLSGTLSAPAAEGQYTLTATVRDDLGNPGSGSTWFKVDRTGPTTAGPVTVSPSPNDGTQASPYNTDFPSVQVVAGGITDPTLVDGTAGAGVADAEAFIDTRGNDGTGFLLTYDGNTQMSATGYIPLSQLTQLSPGDHPIWVHAKDTAGNWGGFTTGTLTIQRAPLFADGFESSPPLSPPWTSVTGGNRLAVTTAAAMTGSKGLQATASNSTAYVVAQTASTNTFHVQFQLNPNSIAMGSRSVLVYQALQGSTALFSIRLAGSAGGGYTVTLVQGAGTTALTPAVSLANSSTNTITVDWVSGSPAVLTVNHVANTSSTNASGNVTNNRLGLAAWLSGTGNRSGSAYFDAFVASRYPFTTP